MPSKKYYRCCLSNDVVQIIGNFSGDGNYKLVFTWSTRRQFLSTIMCMPRRKNDYYYPMSRKLTLQTWIPVRIGNHNLLQRLLELTPTPYTHVFQNSYSLIYALLSEVHDYVVGGNFKTHM